MKKLHLGNDKVGKKLRGLMTDDMWQQCDIKHTVQTILYSDNKEYRDLNSILKQLGQDVSFKQTIKNAHAAVIRAVKQNRNNKPLKASQQTIEQRKALCTSCPFTKKKFYGEICTRCGCIIKNKIKLTTESCPINKW